MAKAWIKQDSKQIARLGSELASWYAEWNDTEGKRRKKSFGPGSKGKKNAQRHCRIIEGTMAAGCYSATTTKTWAKFRTEYESSIVSGLAPSTQDFIKDALNCFERIIKPRKLDSIRTTTIDEFRSKRRVEPSKRRKGEPISPATTNKELRAIKAALRTAARWNYISKIPQFTFEREPQREMPYYSHEEFGRILEACSVATLPTHVPNVEPSAWWRAFVVAMELTGWRVGQLLRLQWSDVDLEAGTAKTRAKDNKGKRDARIPLHPLVVEELRAVKSFNPLVFPWIDEMDRRQLYDQFRAIEKAAKVDPSPGKCFHKFRATFATMAANQMPGKALQTLMQHSSFTTTLRYINQAEHLTDAVANLSVPPSLKKVASP